MRFGTLFRVTAVAAIGIARPVTGQSAPDVSRGQSHHFGTVLQGSKVVHSFTLRNDGTAPLTIRRVDLSEHSMKARFAPLIPPGKEGQVRVEWDTDQIAGEVEAEAVVRFEEPARPGLTFVLKGIVTPAIEFLPYPAVFASVFAGEGAERRVRIVNHEDRPLAIRRVISDSPHFAASLVTLEPGRLYELRVEVPKSVPPGRYAEALSLDTDHPARGRIPIAVNLFVKTELYADPEAIDFGVVSLDELAQAPSLVGFLTQTVMIKKRKGNFRVKAVESDLQFLVIARPPD